MPDKYSRFSELPHQAVDVIVIGSGFAGLAAAIEAAAAGASVIVVEKMLAPGGNSLISDGGIAAPGTVYQLDAGITWDSPELMYRDMITAGEGLNHPQLVKVIAAGAKAAFLWTEEFLGVSYKNRVDIFGGHSVARCHTPESVSGRSLIKKQIEKLTSLGVPLYLGTPVKALVQDERGRVVGIKVADRDGGLRSDHADQTTIHAAKAVIVAAGGFGSDVAFRQAQDPRLDETLMSTNKPSATAEILKECMWIGANPVQLSRIQLGPWASPDEKGFGLGPLFGDYVALPYGVLIDPATGGRFVNELSDRKTLAEAMLRNRHPVIGIADAAGAQTAGWDLQPAVRKGVVKTFASLAELAADYGIDPGALQDSLSRFNHMVIRGEDCDFYKPLLNMAAPIEHPPFYAMRFWPKVHYTMGGIQIDVLARVIHRDQYPIDGLFAAGEVTGGIHGACRLGSCAITECLVMGRIAGQQAARL
ncbi:MAG: flavocytochrome c [Syntrophomonas sp.]|nr:flavocytochrome c [Syntrophomonas sp.]